MRIIFNLQHGFFFKKFYQGKKNKNLEVILFEAEGQRGVTQEWERDSSRTGKNVEMWPRLVHKVQCQQSKWIRLLPSVAVCGAVWHGFVQLTYTNTCLATRPSVTLLLVSVLINGWTGNTSLHYRLTIAPWHAVLGQAKAWWRGCHELSFHLSALHRPCHGGQSYIIISKQRRACVRATCCL